MPQRLAGVQTQNQIPRRRYSGLSTTEASYPLLAQAQVGTSLGRDAENLREDHWKPELIQ